MESLFELVFQNGEFIENKSSLLGVSFDTIFTVITTVSIFVLGYVINRKIEQDKETKRLMELQEYFLKLVELLEEPIIKQKEHLVKFSKKLREKKTQHYVDVGDLSFSLVSLINEINNKDLYNIFIKNKRGTTKQKTELFKKLRSQIDYLDAVKININSSFKDLITRFDKYQDKYSESIGITDEAFNMILAQNYAQKINPQEDYFLSEFDRIRAEWFSLDNSKDRYIASKNYLEPLIELCNKCNRDIRVSFVSKHVKECLLALDNIEQTKYVFSRHFLLTARGLQTSIIEIKKTIAEFNKL
jgi:hypothetical protein